LVGGLGDLSEGRGSETGVVPRLYLCRSIYLKAEENPQKS